MGFFDGIKKGLGIHSHEWKPYGPVYEEQFREEIPIMEDVLVGVQEWDDGLDSRPIYESVETGEFTTRTWVEKYQSRDCATCGKTEIRRVG